MCLCVCLVLFQSGCLAEALESFEKAGNWQMTFALAGQLEYGSTERMQLARRMAGEEEAASPHRSNCE